MGKLRLRGGIGIGANRLLGMALGNKEASIGIGCDSIDEAGNFEGDAGEGQVEIPGGHQQ